MTLEDKYKPKKLSDVVGNKEAISQLRIMLEGKGEDHFILLHGPPGGGKTSISEAFCQERYGEDWKSSVLVINGSQQGSRGIATTEEKIIPYMKTESLDGRKKLIFIDEMDGFSNDALIALRRPFEEYRHNCMVIVTCNQIEKIIKAIQDRFHLHKISLTEEEIITKLHFIMTAEKVVLPETTLKSCVTNSGLSLRKAIQNLEEAINGRTSFDIGNYEISKSILLAALNGEYVKAISTKVEDPGYTIKQMWEEAIKMDIPDQFKSDISMAASVYLDRSTRGYALVQFIAFVSYIFKTAYSYRK